MSEKYIELLRDPRWQRKRLEKLQEAGWRCRQCNATDRPLNVHHKKYRRGAKPWEYDLSDLEVRCEGCHKSIHQLRDELDRTLDGCDWQGQLIEEMIAYCATRITLCECTGQTVACTGDSRARGIAAALDTNPDYVLESVVNEAVDVTAMENALIEEWLRSRGVKK